MKTYTIVVITFAVLAYAMLFSIVVYAQKVELKCPEGDVGPKGPTGPVGPTGPPASGATAYLQSNGLYVTLEAPAQATSESQQLPGVGVPWQTLQSDGDAATYTFVFQLLNFSTTANLQTAIKFVVSGASLDRPFSSDDAKQNITLEWERPTAAVTAPSCVQIRLTRNTSTQVVVTILQGARWVITEGEPDNTASNIYCDGLNFKSEDLFVQGNVNIPVESTEKIACFNSTIEVVRD